MLRESQVKLDTKEIKLVMRAAKSGDIETVLKYIDEMGVDINLKDKNNNTMLINASMMGHVELAKILLEKGANPNVINKNQTSALTWASTFNNLALVKSLLKHDADVSVVNAYGKRPIEIAEEHDADCTMEILSDYDVMPMISRIQINKQDVTFDSKHITNSNFNSDRDRSARANLQR